MANSKPCPRCGLPKYDWRNPNAAPSPTCGSAEGMFDFQLAACRDREIELLKGKLLNATRGLRSLGLQIDGILAAAGDCEDRVSLTRNPGVFQGEGKTDG